MLCKFKTLDWKYCFGCDIPPLCGLKLLKTLWMKSYSKRLNVDWVQISYKFFAEIEMYVLRDTIKNKRCYFKKIRNFATDWRRNGSIYFFGAEGGDGMDNPSLSPSMVATDFSFCHFPPTNFSPQKKSMLQYPSVIPLSGAQRWAKIRHPSSVANFVAYMKIPSLISLIPSLVPYLFGLFFGTCLETLCVWNVEIWCC